ncbi:unnamed protein product [Echinostoma caproni]|uniref:Kelch domain-containing protein 4 n=1 Tax=Echinostoma caproni TaxID=27848 RepID=A0A183APQ4_9TREM|nr:unnamed protein product [Echinostoma caproni]
MGKKDKSKKGKGAEKTSGKAQKKLEKRLIKAEKCTEEQSIEEMLEEFHREQQKLTEVICTLTGPPTPRCEGSVPSARSGHRMLLWKQSLLLFGGFSDTGRNIYLCGGYRKEQVTKDLERGLILSDFFRVTLDKDGSAASSLSVRPSGLRPKPPRNAMAGIAHGNNRALIFGGVHDVESEDGETVVGYFHNDLYAVELDKAKWHQFNYATAKETDNVREKPVEPLTEPAQATQISEGAFTLTINQSSGKPSTAVGSSLQSTLSEVLAPSPRSSSGIAIMGSTLFLYGGVFEAGDREVTLDDFFCLDLNQPVSWKCLFAGTQDNQEWFGSDIEDEDDDYVESDSEEEKKGACSTRQQASGTATGQTSMEIDEGDSSDSSDDEDEELTENAPLPEAGETYTRYWSRTSQFWCELVQRGLGDHEDSDSTKLDGPSTSIDPAVLRLAERLSKDFHSSRTH